MDQRPSAFEPSGDSATWRGPEPGKVSLTQTLPAAGPEGADRSAPEFEPALGRRDLNASHRAGDWEADDSLMSAFGLGPVAASLAPVSGTGAEAVPRPGVASVSQTRALRSTSTPSAATPSRQRTASAPAVRHPTTHLELGEQRYTVIEGKLISGREELGLIDDAGTTLGTLARTAPTSIVFRPAEGVTSPASGDLLANAPEGSTVTVNAVCWVWNAGTWNRLTGKKRKKRSAGAFHGYTKSGGGSVRDRLAELTTAGQLHLTGEQISALGAVAEVETGGQIGCVQTYDNQIVSVGFKQVVLGHGSLQKVMEAAPAGFAKHGLTLDRSKHYVHPKWSKKPLQIEGCEELQELRSPEWAIKFYHASMEPDVIAAICELALVELRKVDRATAAKREEVGHPFFDDLVAKSWLLEVYNNRPAFMGKAIARASVHPAATREAFLDVLAGAIMDTYELEEPLIRYRQAKADYERKHQGQTMPAEADTELLANLRRDLGPVGRKKGHNIVTKIPRTLTPAAVTASPSAPMNSPADAPSRNEGSKPRESALRSRPTAADATTRHSTEPRPSAPGRDLASSQESEAAPTTPAASMRVTAARLNVRSGPSTSAQVVGTLRRGEVFSGTETDGSWICLQFRGRTGFVHRDHVEPAGKASGMDTFGMGDLLTSLPDGATALGEAVEAGFSWLASNMPSSRESRPAESRPVATSAPTTRRAPRAPAVPLPVSALADPELEQLVEQLSDPAVTSIASELAGLKSRSRAMRRDRQEEQGAARDQLVEDIGALRTRLEALDGTNATTASFKRQVYRAIQDISPYYFQSRNIDILESSVATQTRTCNLTVLGMALESLGKSPAAFQGHRASVRAAARIYSGKIMGDEVSEAAVDMTEGRGTSWEQLVGMRLPDFLELAAIAREAAGATEEDAVKAAAQTAWGTILNWSFLQDLASDFGVTATIKYFNASGIQSNRRARTRSDRERIRAHGDEHRLPVDRYVTARIDAARAGRQQERNQAIADRLRPGYDEAVADEGIDDQVPVETYRTHLLDQVGKDLDAGHAVIVGLANHFVRLQSLHEDHIVVDDPARDTRSATNLTYAEARAMGYFHMRFVVS